MALSRSTTGGRGLLARRWLPTIVCLVCSPGIAQVHPAIPGSGSTPVETVSDDAAFGAALPPLEHVAPPAEPVNTPPTSVATEAEIAQPLPPLGTFDTAPPPTIAATGDEPSKLHYTVSIVGLKQVDLEAQFRALSALVDGGKKAANASQVSARAAEDVKLAERILRAAGYYDGSATSTVTPLVGRAGELQATITAVPGPRYDLGRIVVTGAVPEPTALALSALDLHAGQPVLAQAVEDGEAHVSLRLPEQGYPFVQVGQRDILLDPATHVGDYTLPVDSGPKSRFGALRTKGDPVFALDHLAVFPRFKAGQIYDARRVDDLRQALIATSLFSTVAVEPVRTGQVDADGTEVVDLLVTQNKGPWRNLAGSAGYATGEGIKLQGSWTNRNLFPPEGALTVAAIAGTQQQGLSGTFRRSNAGRRDRTFTAGASIARQKFDAYSAQTVDLSATIARTSTPIWQKRWTYSYGGELIATRENGYQGDDTNHQHGTYLIAALPGQIGYDSSNSLLDPTKGFRVTFRLSPEAQKQTSGGGYDGYARLLLEGSTYRPITSSIVLAGRARVGSILGASTDTIAPSRRYYAGGGGSVRGFGFQELGPKDADNDPIGGRGLTEFAVEARYRFGNYGVVPFVDAGQLTDKSTPSVSHLRYGVGIGGRYYTNFGPFRLDVATPIGRKKGESKVALYISIGQAF